MVLILVQGFVVLGSLLKSSLSWWPGRVKPAGAGVKSIWVSRWGGLCTASHLEPRTAMVNHPVCFDIVNEGKLQNDVSFKLFVAKVPKTKSSKDNKELLCPEH
jgi:hypothetical protein